MDFSPSHNGKIKTTTKVVNINSAQISKFWQSFTMPFVQIMTFRLSFAPCIVVITMNDVDCHKTKSHWKLQYWKGWGLNLWDLWKLITTDNNNNKETCALTNWATGLNTISFIYFFNQIILCANLSKETKIETAYCKYCNDRNLL